MSTSLLKDAFAHHVWATEMLLDACAALTPEQLQTNVPGTYGSIITTLRHLLDADRSYLLRFLPDAGLEHIDEESDINIAQLRAAITLDGDRWAQLLETDIDPDHDMVMRDGDNELHIPAGIRMAQVIHHGTDHRSQVCTALTTLGITPPDIDVWSYAETTGRMGTVALPPS